MTEPSKPVRDTLYHWSRFSCAGGLGWSIHGELADGSLFQTGTIYAEHKDGDEEKCGDRWGWAETLTWRYILHGEQV